MSNILNVYSMLHVSGSSGFVNSSAKSNRHAIDAYLLNGVLLSRSLRLKGINYSIITNDKDYLLSRAAALNVSDQLVFDSVEFRLNLPEGLKFRNAHYKIDLYRYFSGLSKPSLLIDLDMFCTNASKFLEEISKINTGLAFYNILDQVCPAYGWDVIKSDLGQIGLPDCEKIWCGGEFIYATPTVFGEMHRASMEVLPRYLALSEHLHHQGDEMLTTYAVNVCFKNKISAIDISGLGFVYRCWSGRIKHEQMPVWRVFNSTLLIHLPQEKALLACLAMKSMRIAHMVLLAKLSIKRLFVWGHNLVF